jgi:hypothetical protein
MNDQLQTLTFYFSFENTYETHLRANTKMHLYKDDIVLHGESREESNGRSETL